MSIPNQKPKAASFIFIMILSLIATQTIAQVVYSEPVNVQSLPIGNVLKWQTSFEDNSQSFIVEKSTDGTKFKKIGVIMAAGESSDEKDYSYLDIEQNEEKTFYRLKHIGLDATSSYSTVMEIHKSVPNDFSVVSMSNTTTEDAFTLTLDSSVEGDLLIDVKSYKGEFLYDLTERLELGLNEIELNLQDGREGLYKIALELGEEQENIVIKKKEVSKDRMARKGKE